MKILFDLNNLFFRSMHAGNGRMSLNVKWIPRALDTSSLKISLNVVEQILRTYRAQTADIIFCDDFGKSFRHKLFPSYKKNRIKTRTPAEENAVSDMFYCKLVFAAILGAFGAPTVFARNFEADDVIGALTKSYRKKGEKVVIWSNDFDLAQLINEDEDVSLIRGPFGNSEILDSSNLPFFKDLGCSTQEDVILYKGLVGDPKDNYTGVVGFGDESWKAVKKELAERGLTSADFLKKPHLMLDILKQNPKLTKTIERIEGQFNTFALCCQLAKLVTSLHGSKLEPRKLYFRHPNSTPDHYQKISIRFKNKQDGYTAMQAYYLDWSNWQALCA